MTETRDFHIGDILSITTGCLVSPEHIGGVYKILNWMTGESLMTHQLPRASRECEDYLRAQHPDLAGVEAPTGIDSEETLHAWLSTLYPTLGTTRSVAPLPAGDHTVIDPIAELVMHYPGKQVIAVNLGDTP